MQSRTRWLRAAGAIVLAAFTLTVGAAPTVGSDYKTYRQDYAGEELMRLTNMDRAALGFSKLASDPFLISVARDAAFSCPANGAAVAGRSKSMATTSYFSHSIYGCKRADGSSYTVLDVLYTQFGYNTYRAENIAMNNYGVGTSTYVAGCDINGANCKGPSTTVQESVAVAERGFMKSSAHRADILGKYDRFGCGSWVDGSGMKYYTCLFSLTGPKPLDSTYPVISSISGSGASVSLGSSITLSATLSDNVRLAEGYLKVDTRYVSSWAYSYNVRSDGRSVTISTSGMAKGAHTVLWAARDVSTLTTFRSITFYVV